MPGLHGLMQLPASTILVLAWSGAWSLRLPPAGSRLQAGPFGECQWAGASSGRPWLGNASPLPKPSLLLLPRSLPTREPPADLKLPPIALWVSSSRPLPSPYTTLHPDPSSPSPQSVSTLSGRKPPLSPSPTAPIPRNNLPLLPHPSTPPLPASSIPTSPPNSSPVPGKGKTPLVPPCLCVARGGSGHAQPAPRPGEGEWGPVCTRSVGGYQWSVRHWVKSGPGTFGRQP